MARGVWLDQSLGALLCTRLYQSCLLYQEPAVFSSFLSFVCFCWFYAKVVLGVVVEIFGVLLPCNNAHNTPPTIDMVSFNVSVEVAVVTKCIFTQ